MMIILSYHLKHDAADRLAAYICRGKTLTEEENTDFTHTSEYF